MLLVEVFEVLKVGIWGRTQRTPVPWLTSESGCDPDPAAAVLLHEITIGPVLENEARLVQKVGLMIRHCDNRDFDVIWTIINDGAEAYQGVIPEDRWHEPYMTREKLHSEIEAGVEFWGAESEGKLLGVMGIQDVKDVTLIRHAYVRTVDRRSGVGAKLLLHLQTLTNRPVLIGTWADATWAIRFYEKHGFRPVPADRKDKLLETYWNVPSRQVETSIVLFRGDLPD